MPLGQPPRAERDHFVGRSRLALVASLVISASLAILYGLMVRDGVRVLPEWALRDWTQIVRGVSALAAVENPWAPPSPAGLPYPYHDRLGYPLPALWIGQLVQGWSFGTIAFVWVLLSIGLAGLALARRNLWHVLALMSWPTMAAAALMQWSPLMVAAARFDLLVVIAICKPNIGLAVLAYRPTKRRLILVGVAVLASLVVANPVWVRQWFDAASSLRYVPPVMIWQGGGPLLLLALLRWRLPEGRLLLTLALLPQNLMSYDQFLLFLVCRRGRETMALVVLSWLARWYVTNSIDPVMMAVNARQQFPVPVVLLLFLPALLFVMMRPAPSSFVLEPADEPAGLAF